MMQPSSRFTHPAAIGAAAAVALALLAAIVLSFASMAYATESVSVTDGSGLVGASAAPAASGSKASVKVTSCVSSPLYDNRQITFAGKMYSLAGAAGAGTLQMRVDVYRKFNERRRFKRLIAPGLGDWASNTEPTATVYVRNVTLADVETWAKYKALVRYRWRDSSGKIVFQTKRISRACSQKVKLPTLMPMSMNRLPIPGSSDYLYTAMVRNIGKSEARNVQVGLVIDGAPTGATATVASLLAHQWATVTFNGPAACNHMAMQIDPLNTVREAREDLKDPAKAWWQC